MFFKREVIPLEPPENQNELRQKIGAWIESVVRAAFLVESFARAALHPTGGRSQRVLDPPEHCVGVLVRAWLSVLRPCCGFDLCLRPRGCPALVSDKERVVG